MAHRRGKILEQMILNRLQPALKCIYNSIKTIRIYGRLWDNRSNSNLKDRRDKRGAEETSAPIWDSRGACTNHYLIP